ncbi:diacylglycerol kinase family protein [Cytobacillus sp. NCCP-133]|uniref:diacylglycerol kinase family protein n=1 Tax=Cytobacillus sp. NCCP-133 TaxID=766848 RepID=UPI002230D5A8|nr:diacylglycerol kinase family protein [Cytobacillus sp. NCCP-133]GLB58244.1 undecaprenol kinase [Cytobacillus sp. NCCP-133]
MNLGSKDNKKRTHGFLKSFAFAFAGIKSALMKERNLQIHVVISIAVILLGGVLSISRIEWIMILFAIGGMLSLELMNTAIERVVDLATEDYHPLAKQAKDIAAGAVLVYAALCIIIGIIVFLPRILAYIISL